MFPTIKNNFFMKIQEVCKYNFLIPSISPSKIKSIVFGNFHELKKQPAEFIYKKYNSENFKSISKELSKGFRDRLEESPTYLKTYLESPGAIRQIYKMSRMIVAHNSHFVLVGPPRACGREILQLSALVYPDTVIYEPEVKICGDIIGFKNSFKEAILQASVSDDNILFFYDMNHVNDPIYVDYIYHYLNLFALDSIDMFDKEFCDQLIDKQKQRMKEKSTISPNLMKPNVRKISNQIGDGLINVHSRDLNNFESEKECNLTQNELFTLAISNISDKFHIVINANGIKDYQELNKYHCFEPKLSVMYLEDIFNEDSHYYTEEEIHKTSRTSFNLFDISYELVSKMQLRNLPLKDQKSHRNSEADIDRRNQQLAKKFIEIKSKIHNSILDFYKVITVQDPNDEIAARVPAFVIPQEDMRLEHIAGLV